MYKIATVAVLETLWLLKNNRSYSDGVGVKITSTLAIRTIVMIAYIFA